ERQKPMRLALAQIDTVVGDLDGNRKRILGWFDEARAVAADLVLFPELAVTGYPPEDLLLRPAFVREARRSLELIAREVRDVVAVPRRQGPRARGDAHRPCARQLVLRRLLQRGRRPGRARLRRALGRDRRRGRDRGAGAGLRGVPPRGGRRSVRGHRTPAARR